MTHPDCTPTCLDSRPHSKDKPGCLAGLTGPGPYSRWCARSIGLKLDQSLPENTGLRFLSCLVIALLTACASTPKPLSLPPTVPLAVHYALSLKGAPYRFGYASPKQGFDCSGFVWHVYQKQGINLPRTAQSMALSLPSVPRHTTIPGDLVFFNINGKPFSHVGIYVDEDRFIHAPSQRTGHVLISDLKNPYWQRRFVGARRPVKPARGHRIHARNPK